MVEVAFAGDRDLARLGYTLRADTLGERIVGSLELRLSSARALVTVPTALRRRTRRLLRELRAGGGHDVED